MPRPIRASRLALLAAAAAAAARSEWTFVGGRGAAASASRARSQVSQAAGGPLDALPALPSLPEWVPVPSLPSLPTISQPVWDDVTKTFLETVIAWGVPAIAVGLVGGVIASGIGSKLAKDEARDRRLRRARVSAGGSKKGGMLMSLVGGEDDGGDVGAPREFLKVERINDRYESFAFSLEKATGAPAVALAGARRRELQRRFGDEIGSLNDAQLADFVRLEGEYKEASVAAAEAVEDAARELRLFAVEGGGPMSSVANPLQAAGAKGEEGAGAAAGEKKGGGMPMMRMFRGQELEKKLAEAVKKSVRAEAKYLQKVSSALGGKEASEDRAGLARLVTDRPFHWDPRLAPLELPKRHMAHAEHADGEASPAAVSARPPMWFVLEFFGDVQASQVGNLRQEVTAVLEAADASKGDGVVLVLNTGGGTVTGYGLAATQLLRLKSAGLPLTICVEEVAASGGYMMACCADKIVSSPFAVLGSIGVITDIPNVYDRLKNEGIEFQTITAGKYKRTLTPTKQVTEEDKAKTKEDIEAIFKLFRGFVHQNRPQLDIDSVATGETWFGQDALERKLVDELKSSDDILLDLCKQGCELYSVKYAPQPTSPLGALLGASAPAESLVSSGAVPAAGAGGMGWWARRLFEFATGSPAGAFDAARAPAMLASRPDQLYRAEDLSSQDFRV